MSKYNSDPLKQLRNRIGFTQPLKIVIGAGDLPHTLDWICTNVEELDACHEPDWEFLLHFMGNDIRVDYVFAEHVWEHFTYEQADAAQDRCPGWPFS